jgi:hypothetical protein
MSCVDAELSLCEGGPRFATLHQMLEKEGVDSVHTPGFGFGCIGVGLGRIKDVFEKVANFQGERLVRVPSRALYLRTSSGLRAAECRHFVL